MRPNGFAQILANRNSGEILVVWKLNKLTATNIISLQHCLSVDFEMNFDKTSFKLTTVYDPPSQLNRSNFFSELRFQCPTNGNPWIVMGDFNQTLNIADRSNLARGPNRPFASLVASMELIDLPLQGRIYTWSRGRGNPTFVHLDRVLISNSWSLIPNTTQKALQSVQSDHCPLQCNIKNTFPLPNTFPFENYWLQIQDFKMLVTDKWQQMDTATTAFQLFLKLQTL